MKILGWFDVCTQNHQTLSDSIVIVMRPQNNTLKFGCNWCTPGFRKAFKLWLGIPTFTLFDFCIFFLPLRKIAKTFLKKKKKRYRS